jgi:hypothetical protein
LAATVEEPDFPEQTMKLLRLGPQFGLVRRFKGLCGVKIEFLSSLDIDKFMSFAFDIEKQQSCIVEVNGDSTAAEAAGR